jgi:CheY-like chemotaxis protein
MTVAKALVVDDSKVAHLTLRKLLMERSIEVDWVGSGEASLDYLQHQTPDVVFMDIMMPGMDGFETLQALHTDPNISVPQIVMCSANATSEDRVLAEQHGAVAFLTKPYTGAELDKLLATLATTAPKTPPAAATPSAEDGDDLEAALSRYETTDPDMEPVVEPLSTAEPEPLSLEPLDLLDQPSKAPEPDQPAPAPAVPPPPAAASGVEVLERADLESLIHEIAESVNRKNAEVMMHAARQASTRAAESAARKLIEERVPQQSEPPITAAELQDWSQTLARQLQTELEQQIKPQVEAAVQASIGAAVEHTLAHTLASEQFGQQLDQRIRTTALAAAEGQSRDIANKVVRDRLAEQTVDNGERPSGSALAVAGAALVLAIAALGLAVANWLGMI